MKKSQRTKSGKVKVVSSKQIYTGKAFGVRRDELVEPGGLRTVREVVSHPGSVVVLPVLDDGRILMVRQYRHATKQYLWELVAGRIEPNEVPKKAAARELVEETGYSAKSFQVFLDVYPAPGFLEERMYILLAKGLTAGKATPEEDERIEVKAFRPTELKTWIRTGKMHDSKSVAGLLFYFNYLAR